MNIKACRKCLIEKPLSDFWKNKISPDGLNARCSACLHGVYVKNKKARFEASKRYRNKWPERERNRKLLQRYGISQSDYEAMFREQNGVCAICQHRCYDGKILVVDHDHATGKVRGLLCRMCNWFIGRIKENPESLLNYFDSHGVL